MRLTGSGVLDGGLKRCYHVLNEVQGGSRCVHAFRSEYPRLFLTGFSCPSPVIPGERMHTPAFAIGFCYLIGGLIPLLPYFLIQEAFKALIYLCTLTGIALLPFGVVNARLPCSDCWRGDPFVYTWCVQHASGRRARGIARAGYGIVATLEDQNRPSYLLYCQCTHISSM